MPTGTIDSAIFKDIFGTEAMRQVWSDGNRIQKYLDFEAGLARAQAKLKIIPQEACDEILKHVTVDQYDFEKLKKETERIGYPVLPVVSQLVKLCKGGLGEWCHWGATTQDITDTATIMQIREGLAIIEKDIDDISDALAALAKKYRDTPMAGRSNLQQAVPITFGYKVATYLAAFERHKQRLKQLKRTRVRVRVRRCGGHAVLARQGRAAHPGRTGQGTQPRPARDRLAHGARPHRRGRLLPRPRHRHLRQDRLRREADDADRGRGGVRAVPRGPRLVLDHAAEAQPDLLRLYHRATGVVRTQVAALLNAMEQDHERATGQWEIEWLVLPEIFVLTAGCLAQTKFLVSGLQVDEKRMRANLDITKGLIVSEAVMMGLGPHLGRQYAHDLVYDVCRQVVATGRPLADLLAENQEIAKHMSKAELQKLCDPANYLGQAGEMVDRVLAMRQRS